MNTGTILLVLCCSSVISQLLEGDCDRGNSCGAHGECIADATEAKFWCKCADGFGGAFCEQRCHLKCGNGKKCVKTAFGRAECVCEDCDSNDRWSSSRFDCPPGRKGFDCFLSSKNQKRDPCFLNPCKHGQCLTFEGGFQCLCDDGYSGSFCQEGQNYCSDNKCLAGARCTNSFGGYFCDCPLGRSGQFCERIDCSDLPGVCNNGKCVVPTTSGKPFDCECQEGFEGEFCEKDKNECLAEGLCFNNGSCVNLNGSFRCECPAGFTGKWCEERVDMCSTIKCSNGGMCMHTERQQPVCQCKNGFIGQSCEQKCPSGYGGVQCTIPLTVGGCSRHGNRCRNGGRCIRGFCVCPPDFTGDQCELERRDLVRAAQHCDCSNNGYCIQSDSGTGNKCICEQGFVGNHCEQTDFCASNPCANNGKCHLSQDSFVCKCPPGFSGLVCDISLSPFQLTQKSKLQCEYPSCAIVSGNGICNAECNNVACDFDGGDCSGNRTPFAKCKYACADVFADGVCNPECNSEQCLYDGMDCMPTIDRCPLAIREHCSVNFANGACNSECNVKECGFDGGDCVKNIETTVLTDIRVTMRMNPEEFRQSGGQALMNISQAIQMTVRIQKDADGPLVFEWNGEAELGRVEMNWDQLLEQQILSSRTRHTRNTGVHGVVAYLEMEEICDRTCRFSDSQSVVDMITAGLAKTNGATSFGVPITEALVASPRRSSDADSNWSSAILLAVVGIMIVCVVIAGMIAGQDEERSRTRRNVTVTSTWIPDPEDIHDLRLWGLAENDPNAKPRSQTGRRTTRMDLNWPSGSVGAFVYNPDYRSQQESGYATIQCYGKYPGTSQDFDRSNQSRVQHGPATSSETVQQCLQVTNWNSIHVQAAGPYQITNTLTTMSVIERDSHGRTVLHWLAANRQGKSEDLIVMEATECIRMGADVNARDNDANTPLMLAVRTRRSKLVIMLLRAGSDPTMIDKSDRNVLHLTASYSDYPIMKILLTNRNLRKDIDQMDRNGMTPLMLVASKFGAQQLKLAELLLLHGAKVDENGVERYESPIFHGQTALHFAVSVDNVEMATYLLSHHAYKDKQDEEGYSPVMVAAMKGHKQSVKMLTEKNASLNLTDYRENTAAQLARKNHFIEIAEYLEAKALKQESREGRKAEKRPLNKTNPNTKATKKTGGRPKKVAATSKSVQVEAQLTPPPSDGSSYRTMSPRSFPTPPAETTRSTPPTAGAHTITIPSTIPPTEAKIQCSDGTYWNQPYDFAATTSSFHY
ncbi:unnamed protein product [Caenorhabditis sp. 36 PRJEB53466]|nr:unnamed protein product [Caenorhabditis sp. 36 PRJEB53466]